MAIAASAQTTIVDMTDGYSVFLTSEAYTFPGTTSAAKDGSTTTQVIAMQGAKQVAASVVLSEITSPSGVTVTKDSDATAPTLTITVSTSVTGPGNVTIPVHVGSDIVINKTFSYAIAFTGTTGAAGKGISGTPAVTYQAGTSGTTPPTGSWASSIPTVAQGQYLWTQTVTTYTDSTTTTAYAVARSGADGSNGADAITLAITSSNGFIFKNTSIETVLTAHVYKAGAEVTGSALTALGTVKWYKDGGATAVGTGATFTIDAGDVTGKATYTATLE